MAIASAPDIRARALALAAALVVVLGATGIAVAPIAKGGPAPGTPAKARGAGSSGTALLVRFRDDVDATERRVVRRLAGVELEGSLPVPGLEVVRPVRDVGVARALEVLAASAGVLYAERDARRASASIPSDPLFDSQWGLHNTGQEVGGRTGVVDADVDAPEAWDLTTGGAVSVGVVDSGVELDHPDLAPNLGLNPGETGPGEERNRVDDDRNGYVDDVVGWDWVDGDNVPVDRNGHGTHVAGTVGARGGDATGVAGMAPDARVVPLRVLGGDGGGRVSDAIRAYAYAARSGIRVVNASLTGTQPSLAEQDAIAAAPDTLFVVAAGNQGADNETAGAYPCSYPLVNVICVAATDQSDELADFSNYGAVGVDLGAPGAGVHSSYRGRGWASMQGTSMATPHVAGAAALVLALRPRSTVAELRTALLSTVDVSPALTGRVATGGRLNAHRALAGVLATAPAPEAEPIPVVERALGTPIAHRPSAFRVRSGSVRRGTGARSRLFRNDGRRLEVVARRSGRRFVAGGYAVVRLSRVRRRALERLELSLDGGTTSRRGVNRLAVYDWSGRRWHTLASVRAGRADRVVRRAIGAGARRYVSPRGEVRVAVRSTAPTRFSSRADLIGVVTR